MSSIFGRNFFYLLQYFNRTQTHVLQITDGCRYDIQQSCALILHINSLMEKLTLYLMHSVNKREIGKQAEERACLFLQTKGLRLLEKNYHSRFGEVDLIMRDQDNIVFVE